MEELTACRICLATDVKLVKLCQYQLIQTYETLSGTQYLPTDYLPHYLCAICVRMLQKCAAFKCKCCISYNLLNQATIERPITTAYIKSLDRILCNLSHPYTFHKNNTCSVKEEDIVKYDVINYIEVDESLIKNENDINEEDLFNDSLNDTHFSSDEEPLSKVLKKKHKIKKIKAKCKKTVSDSRKKKNKCDSSKEIEPNEDIGNLNEKNNVDILNIEAIDGDDEITNDIDEESLNNKELNGEMKCNERKRAYNTQDIIFLKENHIDIVYLSKDQQKQQIECRKTSNNYVLSQFKCNLCNKGYMMEATYLNHMTIHDPCRGNHVCDICQSTFSSARNLASHEANAHSRNFVCQKCNAVFKSCHKAKEHIKWHEGVTFDCHLCGASFRKRTTYTTHVRVRHQSGVICEMCGECFSGAYGLNMHVKKSHRGHEITKSSATTCEHCSMKFKNEEAFEKHKLLANGDACDRKLQHCHICGQSFACHKSLGHHMESHKSTKRYNCVQCNKSYSSVGSYKLHCQRHHGPAMDRPAGGYVCEHCGNTCSNKYTLVNHIRSHTGEKPFQCKLCPKRFTLPQRLQIHVRTHTGERPFQCAACPKAFTHKAGLNRHSAVHTGVKPYTCIHCEKSFSQSNSLKIHISTVHLKQPAPYRRNNRGSAASTGSTSSSRVQTTTWRP